MKRDLPQRGKWIPPDSGVCASTGFLGRSELAPGAWPARSDVLGRSPEEHHIQGQSACASRGHLAARGYRSGR